MRLQKMQHIVCRGLTFSFPAQKRLHKTVINQYLNLNTMVLLKPEKSFDYSDSGPGQGFFLLQ